MAIENYRYKVHPSCNTHFNVADGKNGAHTNEKSSCSGVCIATRGRHYTFSCSRWYRIVFFTLHSPFGKQTPLFTQLYWRRLKMQPFLYRYGKSSEHVCYCYFTHQSSIWKPSTLVDILKDSLLALHYKRRLFSLKKGCFNASLGVNLSEGSNFSNPCSKSIRSPPE